MTASRGFLPFREGFRESIRSGSKTVTTRSKKYGEPGDVLDTPFGPVRLVEVEKRTLKYVRDMLWREEGLASPDEFVRIWDDIHPGRGFQAEDVRFVHRFQTVECASFEWDGRNDGRGRYCANCGVAHGPHGG